MARASRSPRSSAARHLERRFFSVLDPVHALASEIEKQHYDMIEAHDLCDERRDEFLQAFADAVAPALQAICTSREVLVAPPEGTTDLDGVEFPVVELGRGRRSGAIYYLGAGGRSSAPGSGGFYATRAAASEILTLSAPPPIRDLSTQSVVCTLAERLEASMKGSAKRRSVEARQQAERLRALEVILRACSI